MIITLEYNITFDIEPYIKKNTRVDYDTVYEINEVKYLVNNSDILISDITDAINDKIHRVKTAKEKEWMLNKQ